MLRSTTPVALGLAALLAATVAGAGDAPKRLAPAPTDDIAAPVQTIAPEYYEPKVSMTPPPPPCQVKIGDSWSSTPAKTLEECAALLDQKTPVQPKQMSTAYWNNLYLSADEKNIYQADAKSDWSVLRKRVAR